LDPAKVNGSNPFAFYLFTFAFSEIRSGGAMSDRSFGLPLHRAAAEWLRVLDRNDSHRFWNLSNA
jgi:hypothetical protein